MKHTPNKKLFRSVAGKLTGVLALCIFLLVLINWVLNSFVLLNNYERERGDLLVTCYEDVNAAPRSQRTLAGVLDGYRAEYGTRALLWSDTHVLYSDDRLSPSVFLSPLAIKNGTFALSHRTEAGQPHLVIAARTVDGLNLMVWISLSDVQSGTDITNRFLLWSGIITLVIGTVAVILLARSMTRPIRRLSRMAQQMAQLDFAERYTAGGHDELAELGNSLNTVSEAMESTLSELKTANLRLQNDMEQHHRQSEARTRFIRNVSHELKTPIALIQNYAELLHEDAATDAESRAYYCGVIEDEAQKLTQILSKLTTLMQLESGKEELQIERFDIVELLSRLLMRYAPLFEERGIALPVLPEVVQTVWGDAVLIENVAANYLSNALHHVSADGAIRITLSKTEHNTVVVSVFNTGDPIPEEDLPHIWESFYKVDKARTREYGGTGIGLSVVAAIMNAHHMPFGVQNTEDGVCFTFELSAR